MSEREYPDLEDLVVFDFEKITLFMRNIIHKNKYFCEKTKNSIELVCVKRYNIERA